MLRYFNPAGAHESALIGELPIGIPQNLVSFSTQSAIGKRGKIIIHGDDYNTPDGTPIRDFIHVVDVAKVHISALKFMENNKGAGNDVFNLSTGNGYSVLGAVKTFEKATGESLDYGIGPRSLAILNKFGAIQPNPARF